MKRILLAAVLLLALLTGCGQQAETAAAQSAADTAVPSAETSTETEATVETDTQEETASSSEQTEQQFHSLALYVAQGEMTIRTGETFSFTENGGSAVDYEIVDGVLSAKMQDADAVLTLPEGERFTALTLTVDEGHVYVEDGLPLQTLALSVSQGEVNAEDLTVTDCSTLLVRNGSAYLTGELGELVTAVSEEGQLRLELDRPQEDYNIDLTLSDGSLLLGSERYQGRSVTEHLDNGGSCSMELTCNKGELSVVFAA